MTTSDNLVAELLSVLPSELNIQIPAEDTDLLDEGIIDSFGLVNLMFLMERRWGIRMSVDKLDLDNMRSVERIAAFIEREGTR